MKWLFYLLLAAVSYAPGIRGEQNLYDVQVDAFPDPERIIERNLPLCFDRNLNRNKLSNLEAKSLAVEIVDVCTRVARLKGLNIVDSSKGRDCLHVGIEWNLSSLNPGNYSKALKLYVYDFGFRPAKQVSEIQSTMKSATKGFNRYSAEVLCRGAFHDYPKRLKGASYDIEPTFD